MCSFCPSGNLWGKQVSFRDPSQVVEEMQYLINKFNTNYFYFSDLTFNLDVKKVKALCEEIINNHVKVAWSAMVRIDEKFDQSKNIFDLMKESGCSRLAFGVEGFDVENQLKEWQSLDLIQKNLAYVDSLGIITRTFLLIGFPNENINYYKQLNKYLRTLPIDNIRLAFVVPFPGTELYDKYKKQLVGSYSLFTGEYPLLPVKGINSDSLIEKRKEIVEQFYNSDNYIDRVLTKIKKFPYLSDSFCYFFDTHLKTEGIIHKSTLERFYKKMMV
jgi:anaerobic magnesium-protoporphyrin IX monomethyl ester cyclase